MLRRPTTSRKDETPLDVALAEIDKKRKDQDGTGAVIDGRNRWRACEKLDVRPATRVFEGQDSELVAFVVSLNLHRRHLDESQRAMVAAKIANLKWGGDRKTDQDANLPLDPGSSAVSSADAAKLLNVSKRSVTTATKVKNTADPAVVKAVEQGDMSVSEAEKIANLQRGGDRKTDQTANLQFESSTPTDAQTIKFIISKTKRRNWTKGQEAMALAMAFPEPEKGGRGKKSCATQGFGEVESSRLSRARAVLRQSRDLAIAVLASDMSLDESFDFSCRIRKPFSPSVHALVIATMRVMRASSVTSSQLPWRPGSSLCLWGAFSGFR